MTPTNPDPNRPRANNVSDNTRNGAKEQDFDDNTREPESAMGAKARETAEDGQDWLAEEADSLSDAIDAAAASLDEQDREGLARYAHELSGHLASAAGQLEDRSIDELATDAKQLARKNPALFMLGSIAVGFGLSRFFKASSERDHRGDDYADRKEPTFGDDDMSSDMPSSRYDRDMTGTNNTSTVPHNGHGSNMP